MDEHTLSAPRFSIWVKGGDKHGKHYDVPPEGLLVGRAARCDVILDDPQVSREHARFYVDGGYCFVQDLGSRNGIRVRGRKVKRYCLRSGDAVDLGCCELVLRSEGSVMERPKAEKLVQLVDNIKTLEKNRKEAGPPAVHLPLHPFSAAAVVFVALGGLFWAFTIGALLLGILALFEIRYRAQHSGALLAGAALVAAVAVVGIDLAGREGPAMPGAPSDAAALQCQENLRRIGRALQLYAEQHEGRYPGALSDLWPGYIQDASVLVCPGAAKRGVPQQSYAFPAAGRQNVPPHEFVVHDGSIWSHGGRGGFVLRADGKLGWLNARALEQYMAGLPVK